MLRHAVQGAALAIVLIAVFAAGVWLGMDIEAFNRNMVAVEGPPLPDPRCERGEWYVQRGDTAWAVAAACYPGDHTGERASEIVRLNGVDAGALRVGMMLDLPERGR